MLIIILYHPMFEEGKVIICKFGNHAHYVCTCPQCQAYLFVCSRTCGCFQNHKPSCVLKNIKELSNGLQTVLRRNFCKAFKGEGIEVIARVARQTIKAPRNYRFCLTQCKAEPKRNMDFNIRTLKGCVGVGVLHKPTMVRNLFQFLPDQDYINHGSYMILSNGYQYSHSQLKQNFQQYKNINMKQGRAIRLFIEGGKLVFQQALSRVTLTLPQKLDDLYYGVYLYEQGDQAEVLVKK